LEWYTAEALRQRGYDVRPSTLEEIGNVRIESDDRKRQIDVHAQKLNAWGAKEHLLVECKCRTERIGANSAEVFSTAVNEIRGKLDGDVQGLFVSISKLGDTANAHLSGKGIQTIDGIKVREFLGNLRYDALIRTRDKEAASEQLLREYFFKIRYPADTFCEEIDIKGVSNSKILESRLAYVPLLSYRFEISLETELPGMTTTCAIRKSIMFLIRFVDHHPKICHEFEQIEPDELMPSANSLVQERTTPSALLPAPDMLDPLIEQLAVEEALHRAETKIAYSPIINEWNEDEPTTLTEKAYAEIEDRESVEVNDRRREDEDRILDLDQKISELEADSESYAEELREIDGLEETSRQIRHRAQLQGKITSARLRISGYEKQKSKIQARIDRDVDLIRTKYLKQKKEAVKTIVVRPEKSHLIQNQYVTWIPKFEGVLSLDGSVQVPVEWNGASGLAALGSCSQCGVAISNKNGSLCSICLRLICEEDSFSCSKCMRPVCETDSWSCPTCSKLWCTGENKLSCSFCGTGLCLGCRIICTECGRNVCERHSSKCVLCSRTLCQRHSTQCAMCASFICHADEIVCAGCNRSVCRIHTQPCHTCGRIVCEECVRKRLSVRRLLKERGREKRCVLCIDQTR
jgi:hypothetical protein